ncbi:unnamed protein product [Gongylonema pulchrum]|uniref:Secreted protein n=1 Tax=Gongylonema pulchrum TaxID=637853 RepID=A0A183DTM8_9BILA|nr:unnamed protein product [Gongylonema pulchrum]
MSGFFLGKRFCSSPGMSLVFSPGFSSDFSSGFSLSDVSSSTVITFGRFVVAREAVCVTTKDSTVASINIILHFTFRGSTYATEICAQNVEEL